MKNNLRKVITLEQHIDVKRVVSIIVPPDNEIDEKKAAQALDLMPIALNPDEENLMPQTVTFTKDDGTKVTGMVVVTSDWRFAKDTGIRNEDGEEILFN